MCIFIVNMTENMFACVLMCVPNGTREPYTEVTYDKILSMYGAVFQWCVYGVMSVTVT